MASSKGKNIVICLDGTGNQFKEENSNVVKLFRVLERSSDQEVAYYDPGVGTLADPSYKTPIAKKINKGLGLAFGRGLTKNIEQAYSYLMDQYEENDRIFIFGFSRGAYTARALAGFIRACGLLEKGCQNLIPYAMKLYKTQPPNFEILQKFKSTYGRNCKIHFLGLWDSVSTFGWIYDPVFLPFTSNNKCVQTVRHALAIDERRAFYQPVLWGREFEKSQDIKEVWFAGVHSDVGGGYGESKSCLGKITLKWMLDEARADNIGLKISDEKYQRYVMGTKDGKYVGPSVEKDPETSLKGAWWLVQRLPQRIWNHKQQRKVLQFPKQFRQIEPGSTLHHSVLEKINTTVYRPENLPSYDEINLRNQFCIEAL